MKKIKRKNKKFYRREIGIHDAINAFETSAQPFKVELLQLLNSKGSTKILEDTGDKNAVPNGEIVSDVSLYEVNGFVDLCQGPHVESSRNIGFFKIHRLAGAYWRGDEKKPSYKEYMVYVMTMRKNLILR